MNGTTRKLDRVSKGCLLDSYPIIQRWLVYVSLVLLLIDECLYYVHAIHLVSMHMLVSFWVFSYIEHANFIRLKVSKGTKIRNRYNQVPHLTQDTNGERDKLTVRHNKREPRGQPRGQPFPSR